MSKGIFGWRKDARIYVFIIINAIYLAPPKQSCAYVGVDAAYSYRQHRLKLGCMFLMCENNRDKIIINPREQIQDREGHHGVLQFSCHEIHIRRPSKWTRKTLHFWWAVLKGLALERDFRRKLTIREKPPFETPSCQRCGSKKSKKTVFRISRLAAYTTQ